MYNNPSNYGTSPYEEEFGLDPIHDVSMYYENTAVFEKMKPAFFQNIMSFYNSNKSIDHFGHHLYAYTIDINSSEPRGSLQGNKLPITLKINVKDKDVDGDLCKSKYQIVVRVVTAMLVRYKDGTVTHVS